MRSHYSHDVVEFDSIGLAGNRMPAVPMRAIHWHNEVELNLVESGRVEYLFGGQQVTVESGQLAVFWATTPHRIISTTDGSVICWQTIPLPWFLQWRMPNILNAPILEGQMVREPDRARGPADSALFAQWNDDLKTGAEARRKVVVLEVEARLRRLALSLEDAASPETVTRLEKPTGIVEGSDSGKVEAMVRFIAQNYTEPLQIAEIARAVGLHPHYAMEVFRRSCGLSLLDYVVRHRISHAQRLLITTDAKIVDIAFAAGFGSVSRFYAVFQKACGVSPKEYRRAML